MNTPKYTDKDIKDRKTDFDISLAYNMPALEVRKIILYLII